MVTAVRELRARVGQLFTTSGWSLLATDERGRILGHRTNGFYVDNTRILSAEEVWVDGHDLVAFCAARVGGAALLGYALLTDGEHELGHGLYVQVERFVGAGLRTRYRFLSYAHEPRTLTLRLRYAADFADDEEPERGSHDVVAPVTATWDGGALWLRYEHPGLDRAAVFTPSVPMAYADGVLSCDVVVPAGGTYDVEVTCEPVFDGVRHHAPPATYADGHTSLGRVREEVRATTARLTTSHPGVAMAWRTATEDLARLPLGLAEGPATPMAGTPMYQQFFGRDSLTASWQALLATPVLLRDSLRANAAWMGRHVDDWYDEEPGKMLHQARRGPLAVLEREPYLRYYGDYATSLDFLVFLGQYLGWTGDVATVRSLLPAARAAVDWCERYGDLDGDGFLEYNTHSKAGVKNQGWKDSDTAIVDEHGDVVPNPIAASELQAYWYAGLRHAAATFAACGDRGYAATLVAKARRLKQRFDAAYWMPEHGCYAMALDPRGRQVRSVNSNDGHLLAAGIVPRSRGRAVAKRLLETDLYSGWGIRTLSSEHPAYDPFSYHRGSVWPVESATIGLGLARYGCWNELHRLAEATFAAASLFPEHRLPEVIGGLPRDAEHPHPGIYPRANVPQAWSASCVVGLVQALLALRPAAPARIVLLDPHLPEWLPDLHLEGVRVGTSLLDLDVRRRQGRTTWRARVRGPRLAVVRAPTWHSL